MPKQKPGADKFGVEHEVKPGKGEKPLSAQEVRDKAKHFMERN